MLSLHLGLSMEQRATLGLLQKGVVFLTGFLRKNTPVMPAFLFLLPFCSAQITELIDEEQQNYTRPERELSPCAFCDK